MPNRLAGEQSPYLKQHADNPVQWWQWCPEALARAHETDRPILLSIGYSACHWCHVMAHESFEDPGTAEVMNRLFINIKVDREERTDLDQIYQSAHQLLTGRAGGWPLTMFLTPDGVPFFGGTYFPASPRYGLPGFSVLLEQVANAWKTRKPELAIQNERLLEALSRMQELPARVPGRVPGARLPGSLRELLVQSFDRCDGGFGDAPKFPHPTDLAFLLLRYRRLGDEEARDMVLVTLRKMAEGGIYDQIGGGFCRYSTDARWEIPHFEKMLYDNGPLLERYAEAWQISGDPLFRKVVEDTAEWVMREMQSPAGGYHAALDADSEGEEGRYYVWSRDEVEDVLNVPECELVARHYGLNGPPNFEGHSWHLRVAEPLERTAAALQIPVADAHTRLARARARMLMARARRVRPGLDDKILAGWNGLMIAGMAVAGRIFARSEWIASARRAMQFVRTNLWRDDRLLAASSGAAGRLNAYLDDHAFLIAAALALLEAEFDRDDLDFACRLADALIDEFEDHAGGGFFFTRHDHERLIQRPKPVHDHATASGNGVAARMLARLFHLTGEPRYAEAAERCLHACCPALEAHPGGAATFAMAAMEWQDPPAVLVVRGAPTEFARWREVLAQEHLPDVIALLIDTAARGLPAVLDKPSAGRARGWLCRAQSCSEPIEDPLALMQQHLRNVRQG